MSRFRGVRWQQSRIYWINSRVFLDFSRSTTSPCCSCTEHADSFKKASKATLAQTKGGIKDVQGVLGHSKADTTVNVYMQPIEASVKQTLDAIYSELTTPEMKAEL